MRPRERELEQVVDRRAEDAPDGLVRQRRLREHGLAVAAALEVAVGRLLVAAHVRLEDRPLRLHGGVLRHVARVERVRVAGHHVRPARVPGRERPEDVAHGADDVSLDLAQLRVGRDPPLRPVGEPAPHLRDVRVEEAGEPDRLVGRLADEAGCSGDAVAEHVRSEAAGLGRGARPPVERRGEPALRVRQGDVDLVAGTPPLGDPPERLLELVVAEVDVQRADDRHRDDRGSGQHLVRVLEGCEVDRRDLAVQPQRLLAGADRVRVVLARPPLHVHRGSLVSAP